MKTKIIKLSIFIGLVSIIHGTYANTYLEETINGHKVKVIKYDLNSKDFIFKIGKNENENATSLRDLMDKENGISAVNGVYFCPSDYSECKGKDFTINERYIDGKKYAGYDDTGDRVVFALDKNNVPFLFQTNQINTDKETEIYNGLGNFPLLLKDGKDMIEYYRDRNLIDKKMKAKMSRNFICSDKEGKNLYFGYVFDVELDFLHGILTKIGCYNALNLDAGASVAMIYNARYIVGPGREILDGVIIERKGLNTSELREKTKTVIPKIEKIIKFKTYSKKIEYLEKLSKTLGQARTKIYELNSIDLYDENGNNYGYKIEISDILLLKKLYIINYLDKLIYELEKKIKSNK
ncbi:MAG: phosphodiester glycosidase family protein [Candidatus Gracilibacteria bacterium]|nr:phosphodiester glycosidase family protein [Candidatus Gracilibacteria bacterium]